jgi:threonine dehydrogenase-like Zn-dependent dehydrogenase
MTPVLFDSTGSGPVFVASQKLVAPFGRMVLLGDCGKPEQQHLTTDLLTRNITLLGAHEGLASKQGPWDHKAMGQLFMQWLAEGRIDVQSLISHRFAATDAQAAYDLLMNHREEAMGVILDFTEV